MQAPVPTGHTPEADLEDVTAGAKALAGSLVFPASGRKPLAALLRLLTHQHKAIQALRAELDQLKKGA